MPRRLYQATWGRISAWGYDSFMAASEKAGLGERRRELLAEASGRCLEIGAGTGLNLELWPEAIESLVLSEPDRYMATQLRKRVARSRRSATVVEAPGERLPFDDSSFDTVAMTLVLCNAPDPRAALREVDRLLPAARTAAVRGARPRPEPGACALAGQAARAVVRIRLRLPLQPRHARHDRGVPPPARTRRARADAEGAPDRAAYDLGRGARDGHQTTSQDPPVESNRS